MSEKTSSRGGAAGMLVLFALVIAGLGLAFDLGANHARGFWLGAQPGMRALIGAGASLVVVLSAHALRLALARRTARKGGRRDAVD